MSPQNRISFVGISIAGKSSSQAGSRSASAIAPSSAQQQHRDGVQELQSPALAAMPHAQDC